MIFVFANLVKYLLSLIKNNIKYKIQNMKMNYKLFLFCFALFCKSDILENNLYTSINDYKKPENKLPNKVQNEKNSCKFNQYLGLGWHAPFWFKNNLLKIFIPSFVIINTWDKTNKFCAHSIYLIVPLSFISDLSILSSATISYGISFSSTIKRRIDFLIGTLIGFGFNYFNDDKSFLFTLTIGYNFVELLWRYSNSKDEAAEGQDSKSKQKDSQSLIQKYFIDENLYNYSRYILPNIGLYFTWKLPS